MSGRQLSGGQRQRAWIAMTVAQNTPILLLDEPTTFLDLAHQIEVLDLLHNLNQAQGRTIVMVLHDLNHACRYADYLVAIVVNVNQVLEMPPMWKFLSTIADLHFGMFGGLPTAFSTFS